MRQAEGEKVNYKNSPKKVNSSTSSQNNSRNITSNITDWWYYIAEQSIPIYLWSIWTGPTNTQTHTHANNHMYMHHHTHTHTSRRACKHTCLVSLQPVTRCSRGAHCDPQQQQQQRPSRRPSPTQMLRHQSSWAHSPAAPWPRAVPHYRAVRKLLGAPVTLKDWWRKMGWRRGEEQVVKKRMSCLMGCQECNSIIMKSDSGEPAGWMDGRAAAEGGGRPDMPEHPASCPASAGETASLTPSASLQLRGATDELQHEDKKMAKKPTFEIKKNMPPEVHYALSSLEWGSRMSKKEHYLLNCHHPPSI